MGEVYRATDTRLGARLWEAFAERASILVLPGMPCFRRLRGEPLMADLRLRLLGEQGEGTSV